MKRLNRRQFNSMLLVLGFGLCTSAGGLAADKSYLMATASTGGTYYPVGVAISTLSKVKIQPQHKVSLSAINSAGSAENIKLLRENEVQFAILQGLFGSYAWMGTGPIAQDGSQTHLRSVTMLWQNVEQFLIDAAQARTGSIDDMGELKGKKVALGKKNSGTIGSNRTILGNLGIDIDQDYDLVYGGYGPSANALQNGQAMGISTPAGIPTGAVSQLFATVGDRVKMLEFTDEQVQTANGDLELWTRFVIPAGTYPGQDKDIRTIAQPNFLAVREDVDEEIVYLLTKTIYENLPFLQAIHKATKAMALEKALTGLPMPLHPGALRYYKEAGIVVAAGLVPTE